MKPAAKIEKKGHKKLGLALILIGLALFSLNLFLSFKGSKTDIGKMIINSIKMEFNQNITVLIIASTASWVIPLILMVFGIMIIKRSIKEDYI